MLGEQGLAISSLNIKRGLHAVYVIQQAIGFCFTDFFFFPPFLMCSGRKLGLFFSLKLFLVAVTAPSSEIQPPCLLHGIILFLTLIY